MRIINGLPTPIVSFETHQVYCLRNFSGDVKEGDEDDIRAFHYLWALQPNEQSESDVKWQVCMACACVWHVHVYGMSESDVKWQVTGFRRACQCVWHVHRLTCMACAWHVYAQVTELAVRGVMEVY